jgi:hypothetical protein
MFERILAEFRKYDCPLSLVLLSQSLQIEPSALDGMLSTLERKGRIEVVALDTSASVCLCRSCPIRSECQPVQTWYRLTTIT